MGFINMDCRLRIKYPPPYKEPEYEFKARSYGSNVWVHKDGTIILENISEEGDVTIISPYEHSDLDSHPMTNYIWQSVDQKEQKEDG